MIRYPSRRELFALAAAAACAPFNRAAHAAHPRTDWMAALPDDRRLALLNIPGTHDSCARAVFPLACCQTMTLSEQLDAGIRYLDIRCALRDGALRLFHGPVPLGLAFEEDVRDICLGFLARHPGETIVLLLTNEGGDSPGRFEAAMRAATRRRSAWILDPGDPRLGPARGRLLAIRRFPIAPGTAPFGLDATRWPDNASFTIEPTTPGAPRFRVQDRYVVPDAVAIERKWQDVAAMITPGAPRPDAPWTLNYCSGTSGRALAPPRDAAAGSASRPPTGATPVPEQVAAGVPGHPGINTRLLGRIREATQPFHLGTVMLDYPERPGGHALIDALIGSNHHA